MRWLAGLAVPYLALASVASAEPELTLRLSSWGSFSAGQGDPSDGLLGQVYVAPGVEIGDGVFFSVSAGATTKLSTMPDQPWNNSVEPRLIAGTRIPLPLGAWIRYAWANLFVGGRYDRLVYFAGDETTSGRVGGFIELSFGLNWRCAGGGPGCAQRGAPLFARQEFSIHDDVKGRASFLTVFVQQGLDLAELAGGTVAPTITVQLKQTDRDEEFWNDVLELGGGVRWRAQATPLPSLYGSLTVELRGETRRFNRDDRPSEHRVLVVVGFGLFGKLAGTTL